MSLLTMLGDTIGPHTPVDKIPYAFPTTAPFNVPTYTLTPTPDGTGSVIHPDVVLFDESWNGYRFWMAVTPYYLANDRLENPTVLGSHDGFTWHVPDGLTNPVFPWPGEGTGDASWYNSDTDMVYDPDADELVMIWREVLPDHTELIYQSTSGDGVTWTPKHLLLSVGQALCVSPSIIRVAEDDWRIWGITIGGIDQMWHATTREGPYVDPEDVTFTKGGASFLAHHGDVTYQRGRWVAAIRQYTTSVEYVAVSDDGYSWWVYPQPVVTFRGSQYWDSVGGYRSTIQLDPAGEFAHLWYSTLVLTGPTSCRVGYTRVPMTFLPNPTPTD